MHSESGLFATTLYTRWNLLKLFYTEIIDPVTFKPTDSARTCCLLVLVWVSHEPHKLRQKLSEVSKFDYFRFGQNENSETQSRISF